MGYQPLQQRWPATPAELRAVQEQLGAARPEPWLPGERLHSVGASYICFRHSAPGPGQAGDPAWAAAALKWRGRAATTAVVSG
ncbi:MAG: hypothetical protein M3133_10640, partial [Actinomycetota bacterium]|nr:hypothetical protein [Actinomycetota bacterium]